MLKKTLKIVSFELLQWLRVLTLEQFKYCSFISSSLFTTALRISTLLSLLPHIILHFHTLLNTPPAVLRSQELFNRLKHMKPLEVHLIKIFPNLK